MGIGEDKTRVILTITKDLKESLQEIAKDENRTLTNLIVTILKDYVKNHPESRR